MPSATALSPDGQHFAFSTDGQCYLDGKPGTKYGDASRPVFSPDSRRIAYIANQEGKQVVVVDGAEGPVEDRIVGGPFFSPDSKHVAYIADTHDQKRRLVIDGHSAPPPSNPNFYFHAFSPDGQSVVCGHAEGKTQGAIG